MCCVGHTHIIETHTTESREARMGHLNGDVKRTDLASSPEGPGETNQSSQPSRSNDTEAEIIPSKFEIRAGMDSVLWRLLAASLDRVFFVVQLVSVVIAAIFLFPTVMGTQTERQ